MVMVRLRAVFYSLLVLGSFASVLIVVVYDITGVVSVIEALFGLDNTQIVTSEYDAYTMLRYITTYIGNPARTLSEVQAAVAATQRILYVEPNLTDATDYFIAAGNCSSLGGYQDTDVLYADWYMLPLLQRILVGMNSTIDLFATPMTHVVLVDCDYTGRHLQDTSVFKAFIMDTHVTKMSSVAMVTMNGLRSSTKLEAQVGPAIVSQAVLASFGLGPPDPPGVPWLFGLTYAGTTAYRTLVSFNFPYEKDTTFHDTYDDGILPTNQWNWRVKATNETVVINGYTGYYRGSTTQQANYIRYLLAMTGNPIRDFTVDGLVIMTLGIRIGFTILVALVVSVNSFMQGREYYLPDIFPTIKRHIQIRSVLLLLAFCGDQFWAIQEWVITKTLGRYNLMPMFVLGNGIRSDFLVLFLIWTDAIASLLHVGITPLIPTVVYTLCFTHSDMLVLGLTSADLEAQAKVYLNNFYIRNLITFSPTSMNFWTRFQLTPEDPPKWLVARELTWFFAPCIGMTILLVLYKLLLLLHDFIQPPPASTVASNNEVFDAPATAMASLTCVPKNFLDNFLPSEDGLPTRGLLTHAPPTFPFTKDAFQVHKSILWNAGWVFLDDQYLVWADDLPNVTLNVLSGVSVTKVYCCIVARDDSNRLVLTPEFVPLPLWKLSWKSLFHLHVLTVSVLRSSPDQHDTGSRLSSVTKIKVPPTSTRSKVYAT
ncbi:Aste57867_20773 [Aphanomyces stellatus]|uniref:Aste57867_20773 protein n=1 Tax=Aphanomyces stellatus TaxID=120398 RepID=A0A485LH15_9STRA|nr:hypothetical protein As57867_020705 [Aphanomyces stellatus]VFT97452.1 Aste57867_20773 [Aphanomyces stellatus]